MGLKLHPSTIAVIVTIAIFIISAVSAYGALTEKVDNLEQEWESQLPEYEKNAADIDTRLIDLEKVAAGTEVSLIVIQKDIDEIKIDLKSLIREVLEE
jgi:peptidoglycan hydrolase CwlO-like protein